MIRFTLLAFALSAAAPMAVSEELACGPELDQATTTAREAETRLSREARDAYEMIGWITMDYDEGLIDADEALKLIAEAEEKQEAAMVKHDEAAARLAALREQLIACKAAET